MEETNYQKFAIWVQIIFIIFQVIGCMFSAGSIIYICRTFKISKPIYLVALLDSVITLSGFLTLYVATMAIAIINDADPQYLKGNCNLLLCISKFAIRKNSSCVYYYLMRKLDQMPFRHVHGGLFTVFP